MLARELDKDRYKTELKTEMEEAIEFLEDVAKNWNEVLKKARQILEDRMLNRVDCLPDPEDVAKLSRCLTAELKKVQRRCSMGEIQRDSAVRPSKAFDL